MRIPVAVFALCTFMSAAPVYGADPTLDVFPAEVTTRTLPKDTPIDVEVRLKAGDSELTAISILTFSNDGISAEVAKETPVQLEKLAPTAEYSWRLKLTREAGSVLTESILHVRAAFDVVQTSGAGAGSAATRGATPARTSTHRLLYTTAKIKPQAIIAGIELAKAEIKGAPEMLAHERPGRVFIIVTNQYSRPLKVLAVRPLGPTYVDLINPDAEDASDQKANKPHPKLPMEILPGQAGDIDYKITAKSEVVPGKYGLIATVDVMTEDKLAATIRTAPQEISVIVLGESDILKFLGIPSLLFLPGVVMLLSWRFLWSFGKPSEVVAKYPLQWNTSDFWIMAIALSLFTAVIYPWLTILLPGGRRNFVAAYGLLDFGLILGLSLVATSLAFGGWRAITKIRQNHRARKVAEEARKIAESTPSIDDTPLQILDKVARLRKDNLFEQYHLTGGNQAERLLALEPWRTANELWLVPPVELKGINARNYDGLDEGDNLVNGPQVDAATLLAKLRHGIDQHWWGEPAWRTIGDVRGPIKVQGTGWTKFPHLARLVQGD